MRAPATLFVRPKKSLGQNFLHDENIARKIVAAIHPAASDLMVEIGPGQGALTKYLAPAVRHLTAVDIDGRVLALLRVRFAGSAITFLHQDFLDTDLAALAGRVPIRVVGNIPYNITSPILFHLLDNRIRITDATLMMQREVARRLVAQPHSKDYGILAVLCQLFASVRLLFDVSPNAFRPKPKVMSSLVQLTMLPQPRYALSDEDFFRAMVRAVFGKRRKTLRNSLRYFLEDSGGQLPAEADLQRRPEDLTVQELVALSNSLAAHAAPATTANSSNT